MLLNLFHTSLEPLFYGIIIFLGLVSMVWKLKRAMWLAFFAEVFTFWLVFTLHGGTMTGGFAATVASLLAGIFIPLMFRSK
jgi:hypothetical protein